MEMFHGMYSRSLHILLCSESSQWQGLPTQFTIRSGWSRIVRKRDKDAPAFSARNQRHNNLVNNVNPWHTVWGSLLFLTCLFSQPMTISVQNVTYIASCTLRFRKQSNFFQMLVFLGENKNTFGCIDFKYSLKIKIS